MKKLFKIRYWPVLLDIAVILLCVFVNEQNLLVDDKRATLAFVADTMGQVLEKLPQAAGVGQTLALLVLPIHILLFYMAGFLVGCAFVPVIYFAFMKARLRVAAEKTLYANEDDLAYFRETFPGMKPATVSMLVALDIDEKKDVPASLLQMMDKGYLVLGPDGFGPGEKTAGMSSSEKELARFALGKTKKLERWKELSIEEGVSTGCLQKTGQQEHERQMRKYILIAGIAFAAAMVAGVLQNTLGGGFGAFGRVEGGLEFFVYFWQTPSFAADVLWALLDWVAIGGLVLAIALAAYMAFYDSRYKKLRAPVRRTPQGEQAARRLYGIKNYLHDFTLLGEAAKEKTALWNDFLVYAVVLEENTDIIKEIGKYYPASPGLLARLAGSSMAAMPSSSTPAYTGKRP